MQKLKKYKIIAIIIAVIIIPLVYSFFYLDAFWDPYSKLDKLPVAVVNQDSGAVIDGKTRNLGNEITERLKSDKNLKWVITSDSDAKDGIENRRYYASIFIPKAFSKEISSAGEINKSQGTIIYNVNEKSNFLASQVLSRVSLEFKDKISKDVSKEIVKELVNKINGLPDELKTLDDGLKKANEGAGTLYDKTGELVKGQNKLNQGLYSLNKGLIDLNKGSKTLSSKLSELSNGTDKFNKELTSKSKDLPKLVEGSKTFAAKLSGAASAANKLNAGTDQVVEGADKISKGMTSYNEYNKSFAAGISSFVDSINKNAQAQTAMAEYIVKYTQGHPEALNDPNIQAVIKTIQASKTAPEQAKKAGEKIEATSKLLTQKSAELAAGAEKLYEGAGSITQGNAKLAIGLNQLNKAYSQIDSGIKKSGNGMAAAVNASKQIAAGTSAIKKGTDQFANGITKAAKGSSTLAEGATKLHDGANKLQSGQLTLKNGFSEASGKVSKAVTEASSKVESTKGLDEYVSEPVKLEQNRINEVHNYGSGFTPYFVSLSLWVGALMIFFAIYLDPKVKFRRLSKKSNGFGSFISYTLIGIAQAIVLDIVILGVLHLEVKNVGLFFIVSIIVSLAFTSIMRFLIIQLKDVGKFLAILILILQLTSCGGTFPMELVPNFFNAIKPFMPMTYSINALKEVISGIDNSYLIQNIIVLGAIATGFLGINLLTSKIIRGRSFSDSSDTDQDDDSGNISGEVYVGL